MTGLRLPLRESILIPVIIESPLTGERYPDGGKEVLAVLDTGYTGFALIPEDVFEALGWEQLEPVRSTAKTADGREIELRGNYAVIEVPDLGLREEGLVETTPDLEEILLGVEWLNEVDLVLYGCSGVAVMEACANGRQ